MNQKIKKLILILILLIIVVVFILLVLLLNNQKIKKENQEYDLPTTEDEIEYEEELSKKINTLQNQDEYFYMETILKNYFLYLKVENATAVAAILDNEYQEKNNISDSNIINKMRENIPFYNGNFVIKKIYIRDSINKPIYYTYGILEKNNKIQEFYATIYLDRKNIAYSVLPITKQQYEQYISEDIKEPNIKEIVQNQYNKFKLTTLTKENLAKKYFNDYIQKAVYNTEEAYQLINKKYKESKFQDIQEYRQYLANRQTQLDALNVKGIKTNKDFKSEEEYLKYINNLTIKGINKYNFEDKQDYTQCTCIDDYGNYYIFYITSPMDYTVILDTYTIDLPEFTQQYESASNEQKVLLNIQKCFEAINNQDYKYVYNKLDTTFKANSFKTQTEFENYVKKNFYNKNQLAAGKAEIQNDLYLYQITISNEEDTTQSITKTFVMQLKEGTDFVMSFSV